MNVHNEAGHSGSASAMRGLSPRTTLVVVAVLVAVGLTLAGVIPSSFLLYGGLFGGMVFMHAGGHGGHMGHGATSAVAEPRDSADDDAGHARHGGHRSGGCH